MSLSLFLSAGSLLCFSVPLFLVPSLLTICRIFAPENSIVVHKICLTSWFAGVRGGAHTFGHCFDTRRLYLTVGAMISLSCRNRHCLNRWNSVHLNPAAASNPF